MPGLPAGMWLSLAPFSRITTLNALYLVTDLEKVQNLEEVLARGPVPGRPVGLVCAASPALPLQLVSFSNEVRL